MITGIWLRGNVDVGEGHSIHIEKEGQGGGKYNSMYFGRKSDGDCWPSAVPAEAFADTLSGHLVNPPPERAKVRFMPSKNGPTLRNDSSTSPGENSSAGTAGWPSTLVSPHLHKIDKDFVIKYLCDVDRPIGSGEWSPDCLSLRNRAIHLRETHKASVNYNAAVKGSGLSIKGFANWILSFIYGRQLSNAVDKYCGDETIQRAALEKAMKGFNCYPKPAEEDPLAPAGSVELAVIAKAKSAVKKSDKKDPLAPAGSVKLSVKDKAQLAVKKLTLNSTSVEFKKVSLVKTELNDFLDFCRVEMKKKGFCFNDKGHVIPGGDVTTSKYESDIQRDIQVIRIYRAWWAKLRLAISSRIHIPWSFEAAIMEMLMPPSNLYSVT